MTELPTVPLLLLLFLFWLWWWRWFVLIIIWDVVVAVHISAKYTQYQGMSNHNGNVEFSNCDWTGLSTEILFCLLLSNSHFLLDRVHQSSVHCLPVSRSFNSMCCQWNRKERTWMLCHSRSPDSWDDPHSWKCKERKTYLLIWCPN